GAAIAIDLHRHLDAGIAERPETWEPAGEILDPRAAHLEHDVAGAQIGLARGPAVGQPHHDHAVIDLGGIEPEPGPGRTIATAKREQIVEDRLEQIDRHDHVEMLAALLARLL